MDLSLRAYLAGWKAIYLRHVTVLNEVCHLGFATQPGPEPQMKLHHIFTLQCCCDLITQLPYHKRPS